MHAATPGNEHTAYFEVRDRAGSRLVLLVGDTTIGRGPGNTIRLEHDPLVSTLHAKVEAVGGGWCVRDLGSRNGTYLGGDRLLGERAMRHGDELRVGQTRLTFRSDGPIEPPTAGAAPPPELTRRERDVLRALCRPLLSSHTFAEPASMRQIAAELVVGEAAVQQHLLRLYHKFGLRDESVRRRVQLANEAIERGAISVADLRTEG